MNRREVMMLSGLAATAAIVGVADPAVAATDETRGASDVGDMGCYVVAETASGKVRGIEVEGVKRFLAIPYGGPTGGRNRFMPPTKVAPWRGVRDCHGYAGICPQPLSNPEHPFFGRLSDWDQQPGAHSEDCLNLNIWTPALNDGGRRPVIVNFHGGAYSTGSGNHADGTGDRLARHGNVVVVTVNHRLGAFGYLDLAALGAPAAFASSGNAGLLDLVQSLQWVRDNIAHFGGDPGCVTIIGQSGGGYKVSSLLAMPAAAGLFHRAVQLSGPGLTGLTREVAADYAARLMAQLGLGKRDFARLQQLPFERIVAAQMALGCYDYIKGSGVPLPSAPEYRPVIDGKTLPHHPFEPGAPPESAHVPLLVGYCQHDRSWALRDYGLDRAGLKAGLYKFVGAKHADRVLDAYTQADPDAAPFLLMSRMITDRGLAPMIARVAARKADQSRAPVWVYRLDARSPAMDGRFGAAHGMDIGLMFRNINKPLIGGDTPRNRRMADVMSALLVAFARSGDPGTPLLPAWPAYTRAQTSIMTIDEPLSRAHADLDREFRLMWEDVERG